VLNRWNDVDAREYLSRHDNRLDGTDDDLLMMACATTLLGADNDLTMHGGGNTSVKKIIAGDSGDGRRALYVKASGTSLDLFTPDCFVAMDLDFLEGLRGGGWVDDETMAREFRSHQLIHSDRLPSIESLMHAFIPAKFVAHTHPAAILKIVNRAGGRDLLKECFGDDLAVIPYTRMGYDLALASSEAARLNAGCRGVVIAHHGLVVWGDEVRAVYDLTIDLINRAEEFLSAKVIRSVAPGPAVSAEVSAKSYELAAPLIRECLSQASRGIDGSGAGIPVDKVALALLNTPDMLELINSPDGRDIISDPPMTPDYPMLTRILPLWLDEANLSFMASIDTFVHDYRVYLDSQGAVNVTAAEQLPQVVIIPSAGAVCFGASEAAARRTADFARQAFSIRRAIFETGGEYESLPERHLFDMQYRGYQQAKKGGG